MNVINDCEPCRACKCKKKMYVEIYMFDPDDSFSIKDDDGKIRIGCECDAAINHPDKTQFRTEFLMTKEAVEQWNAMQHDPQYDGK